MSAAAQSTFVGSSRTAPHTSTYQFDAAARGGANCVRSGVRRIKNAPVLKTIIARGAAALKDRDREIVVGATGIEPVTPTMAIGYLGYGDGKSDNLTDFISDKMRSDWVDNRDELMAFWKSGEYTTSNIFPDSKPWLAVVSSDGVTVMLSIFEFEIDCHLVLGRRGRLVLNL